jgi:hypothetical protein
MREREGLIARILQVRRMPEQADDTVESPTGPPEAGELRALEARLTHLEQLVQGFQDSVHRESLRQHERITELEAGVQPAALGKALSEDARNRGL